MLPATARREQLVHDNLQVQENWQVPFQLPSTASLRTCQTPMLFLDPMCTWSESDEVMLPASAWREQLVMTTCKCRKVRKFPFPLLSTASLRVCQTPLLFLDPICMWSECSEVMLPANAWREQLVMTTCKYRKTGKSPFPLPSTASLRACQKPCDSWIQCAHEASALKWCYPQPPEENNLSWQPASTGKLASPPFHFYPQLRCVCARRPWYSWILYAHGARALKWCYPHPPEENNLSWQPASAGKCASFPSHFYPQLRCVCARHPCYSWILYAHGASVLKWCYPQPPEENKYRKVGKSPFPLLSTASLRVCQTPLLFLDPICTWSESAEVMPPATTWKEQLVHDNLQGQENWKVSFLRSRISNLGDGSRISDLESRVSDLISRILSLGSWISDLGSGSMGSRILDLGSGISDLDLECRISDLEPRISDLGSRIWDLGSRISDRGSRILDLGSRILDLGSRISNLGSRISDLGSGILDLESRISDRGSRILDLGSGISDLGSWISDLESWISNLGSGILDLESRISDLESRISNLGSRISNLGSRISDLGSRISDLESRICPLPSAFWKFLHHWKQTWWKMIKMKKWKKMIKNDKKWYLKWLKNEDDKIND